MHPYHRPRMVVLSSMATILVSYAALELAGQVAAASEQAPIAWLGSGAGVLGMEIWAVHFVAMLAFYVPVPISIRAEAF
jgi:methyl-accepting chemotaxis protein PixJ